MGGLSAVSEEEPRDEDAEIATFLKKQASRLHGMQSPRHSKERGSPILSPDEIEMHLHGAVSELLRVEPASGAASPASSLGGSRSASSSAAARRRTVADAINQLKYLGRVERQPFAHDRAAFSRDAAPMGCHLSCDSCAPWLAIGTRAAAPSTRGD